MRLFFSISVYVIGAVLGVLFFFLANIVLDTYGFVDKTGLRARFGDAVQYRHAGTVVSHDIAHKTLTVREESSFQTGDAGEVQFTYDDATQWHSIELMFRDDTLERRTFVERERERILPEGARVLLSRDASVSERWRIAHIAFLKRTSL